MTDTPKFAKGGFIPECEGCVDDNVLNAFDWGLIITAGEARRYGLAALDRLNRKEDI